MGIASSPTPLTLWLCTVARGKDSAADRRHAHIHACGRRLTCWGVGEDASLENSIRRKVKRKQEIKSASGCNDKTG
jgi:hypothetical protein